MSSCVSAARGHPNPNSVAIVRAFLAVALAGLATGCAVPVQAPEPAAWPAERSAWSDIPELRPRAGRVAEPSPGATSGLPEDSTLDDYIAYAMRHSPELDAAWQRWRAAAERVPQAQSLPDPRLGFGIVLDQVDADAEYMGERYSISQMFPWFGKLALRGDVALEDAQVEARRFEAARLALVERVTEAWFELAWLHQAVATARENRELMIHLESVARARYRVGAVSQADVNRAQVELGRLDDQLRSLEDMRGPAAATLNAVLGRPAHARLPGQFDAPSRQPPAPLPELDDAQWLALARTRNPELAAAQHRVAREQRASRWPGATITRHHLRPGIRSRRHRPHGGHGRGRDRHAGRHGLVQPADPAWPDRGGRARGRGKGRRSEPPGPDAGIRPRGRAQAGPVRPPGQPPPGEPVRWDPPAQGTPVAGLDRGGLPRGRSRFLGPRRCTARAARVRART
jgi:hypothetical protein